MGNGMYEDGVCINYTGILLDAVVVLVKVKCITRGYSMSKRTFCKCIFSSTLINRGFKYFGLRMTIDCGVTLLKKFLGSFNSSGFLNLSKLRWLSLNK